MRLLGRDFSAEAVLSAVQERLEARGLTGAPGPRSHSQVEGRVDPLSFNLQALAEHADPTHGLPIESHRDGLSGQLVRFGKGAFRRTCQLLINETLGRQRLFNGHVRDSYAQLSSELLRLRERITDLEAQLATERDQKRRSSR